MEDGLVHYYNVILGKCACGAATNAEEKTFSVFPQQVTCPACRALFKSTSEGPEQS